MQDDPRVLVSTDWLVRHLADPDLRVIDASWHMPDSGRDARAEYLNGHVPGAQFFDIDEISDGRSGLPHMAPPPETFAARMSAMGIGDGHRVVIYDSAGLFSAARVWWLFRLMGQTEVAVLDGGLPKWRAENRALEDRIPSMRDHPITVDPQDGLVRDVTQMAEAVKVGHPTIVDARAADRFEGATPEPRPGLRSGHIPGARNLPFGEVLNADGTLGTPEAIERAFRDAGVDLTQPVVTSCGSGVTAAVLALALARIGHEDWSLYDGSWSEWGGCDDLPAEQGPARARDT